MRLRKLDNRGVSMVEFVLAFPIFMMFVVVIIDLGRVSALGNVIRESMAVGMQTAASVANLDIDPRGLPQADYGYQRSKIARQLVEQNALGLVRGIGSVSTRDDATDAGIDIAKLYDIVYTEDRISDGPDATTYKVAVLLPGECATVPSLGITECNRETLGTGDADPAPTQAAEFLIRKHPVKIVAFAQFDSFTPWLFKRFHKYEQFGFRQPIPPGPFPTSIDPQPFGEIQAEMEPEDRLPLGNAEEPDPVPSGLIPDWLGAIRLSNLYGIAQCLCPLVPEPANPLSMSVNDRCCGPN